MLLTQEQRRKLVAWFTSTLQMLIAKHCMDEVRAALRTLKGETPGSSSEGAATLALYPDIGNIFAQPERLINEKRAKEANEEMIIEAKNYLVSLCADCLKFGLYFTEDGLMQRVDAALGYTQGKIRFYGQMQHHHREKSDSIPTVWGGLQQVVLFNKINRGQTPNQQDLRKTRRSRSIDQKQIRNFSTA